MNVTVGDFKAGPLEKQYVNEVLDSGRLSYGPFSRKFEAGWAAGSTADPLLDALRSLIQFKYRNDPVAALTA